MGRGKVGRCEITGLDAITRPRDTEETVGLTINTRNHRPGELLAVPELSYRGRQVGDFVSWEPCYKEGQLGYTLAFGSDLLER